MTQIARRVDIVSGLYAGDDWYLPIPVAGATWQAGDTARMHVRVKPDSDAILVELTHENGGLVLGDGLIAMVFTRDQTEALGPGVFVYDIEVTRSGFISTLWNGTIRVMRDITRGTVVAASPSLDFSDPANSEFFPLI